MKKLISTTAIFLMFLVGCSNQENSITSPISTDFEQSAQVNLTDLTMTKVDETVIELGTVNKEIDGAVGGTISLIQNVLNSDGQVVRVDAGFEIPADAFVGTQNFTVTVDVNSGSISFSPHITFNKTCILNFELKKMNLADLGYTSDKDTTEFVYFPDSGPILPVLNSEVTLHFREGTLKVKSANIDHFSRYGFIRRD